jgi:hypothetical protein
MALQARSAIPHLADPLHPLHMAFDRTIALEQVLMRLLRKVKRGERGGGQEGGSRGPKDSRRASTGPSSAFVPHATALTGDLSPRISSKNE